MYRSASAAVVVLFVLAVTWFVTTAAQTREEAPEERECHFEVYFDPSGTVNPVLLNQCTGSSWWGDPGLDLETGVPLRNPAWRPIEVATQ